MPCITGKYTATLSECVKHVGLYEIWTLSILNKKKLNDLQHPLDATLHVHSEHLVKCMYLFFEMLYVLRVIPTAVVACRTRGQRSRSPIALKPQADPDLHAEKQSTLRLNTPDDGRVIWLLDK